MPPRPTQFSLWLRVMLGVSAPFSAAAWAQPTPVLQLTPDQFVQEVTRLEHQPVNVAAVRRRAALMQWLKDNPEGLAASWNDTSALLSGLHEPLEASYRLTPSTGFTPYALAAHDPVKSLLFSQYVLARGVHHIEHPQADEQSVETAGLMGMLQLYRTLRAQDREAGTTNGPLLQAPAA